MLSKSEIKYIQSLSHKKFREQEQLFLVEGVKMVDELLKDPPNQVKTIYALDEWVASNKHLISSNIELKIIKEFELEKISSQKHPQEVIALVAIPENTIQSQPFMGVTVLLDHIQDPGNLGTIIRTCDWFGVKNIVCTVDTVDAFNPKVVQSAMGSILRVNVFYTDLIDFIKSHVSTPVYSAVLDGTSIHNVSIDQDCFVVIGNESVGVSEAILKLTAKKISIPRIGKAESLNAAIATAVMLAVIQQ